MSIFLGLFCGMFAYAMGRILFGCLYTVRPDQRAVVTSSGAVQKLTEKAAPPPLTDRECEVLSLISEGLLNKQIADRLGIGVRTIETHRERIMRKLDIHTVAGLTKYAISRGMTTMPPAMPPAMP